MIDLELGPVVAQTGGGVEIVEQQIVGGSGTVTLPDGWGRAWVIAQARTDSGVNLSGGGSFFGWSPPSSNPSYHRVALLEPGGTLSVNISTVYSRDTALIDITMIRID